MLRFAAIVFTCGSSKQAHGLYQEELYAVLQKEIYDDTHKKHC